MNEPTSDTRARPESESASSAGHETGTPDRQNKASRSMSMLNFQSEGVEEFDTSWLIL
jgi:hypothetical protein